MKTIPLLSAGALSLLSIGHAHAADAVVMPEPEPVEYVRVCDAFGAGFFYIPGTETCLQIAGEVWFQAGATSDDGTGGDTPNYYGFGDGYNATTHATVSFDARSNTEWGVLRAYIELEAEWGEPVDGDVGAVEATISLGGLRMGYAASAWAETVFDVAQYGSTYDDQFYYGDQGRHFVQYNFGGDSGLFGTISLEDDTQEDGTIEGDGYMPDVVGVVGYQAEWGGIWGRVGYDESYGVFGDDGIGASAGVQVNVPNIEGSSLRVVGYYADGDHAFGTQSAVAAFGGNGNAEWSALGVYQHKFSDRFEAIAGFQYFSDFYVPLTDVSSGLDGYLATAALIFTPVENFEIRAEGSYDKLETLDGSFSGFLRFTRTF